MRAPALCLWLLLVGCQPEPEASFQVRESVQQLQVTHAETGATLEVVDAKGTVVASAKSLYGSVIVYAELPTAK